MAQKAPADHWARKLRQFKFDNGLLQKEYLVTEECEGFSQLLELSQSLPAGVYWDEDGFYKLIENASKDQETLAYLMLQQLEIMKSIKIYLIIISVVIVLTFLGLIS
jgi:hypothetical protein